MYLLIVNSLSDLLTKSTYLWMMRKLLSQMLQVLILLPNKENDPGSSTINIVVVNGKGTCGMLYLGARINLLMYSIFKRLELGDINLPECVYN